MMDKYVNIFFLIFIFCLIFGSMGSVSYFVYLFNLMEYNLVMALWKSLIVWMMIETIGFLFFIGYLTAKGY